jgi:hypothetical protein
LNLRLQQDKNNQVDSVTYQGYFNNSQRPGSVRYRTINKDDEQATFALTSSHHVGHLSFDLCEISGAMCLLAQDALPRALLAIIPVEKAAMESGPMIVPQNSTINVAIYPMHHHSILQLLVTGKLSRHESMLPRMTTVAAVGEEFEPGGALSETR